MSSKNIYNNTIADYEISKLLTDKTIDELLTQNFYSVFETLISLGYTDTKNKTIDDFMQIQYNMFFDFIKEHCDNLDLLDYIFNCFLYLDAKTAYKASTSGDTLPYLHFYDNPIIKNIIDKDYDELPKNFLSTINNLDKNSKAQEIDIAFEKALSSDNLTLAKKISKELFRYTQKQIDFTNLLTLHRAIKSNFDIDNIKKQLIEGGTINLENFETTDFNLITKELEATEFDEAANYLLKDDLSNFKKTSEQVLYNTIKSSYSNFLKFGPLLKFIFAKTAELKLVNYLLVCLKNNIVFDNSTKDALSVFRNI